MLKCQINISNGGTTTDFPLLFLRICFNIFFIPSSYFKLCSFFTHCVSHSKIIYNRMSRLKWTYVVWNTFKIIKCITKHYSESDLCNLCIYCSIQHSILYLSTTSNTRYNLLMNSIQVIEDVFCFPIVVSAAAHLGQWPRNFFHDFETQ